MYFADYCRIESRPDLPLAWRIVHDKPNERFALFHDDSDLKFGRKIDCELACKSLNEATAKGEDIGELSDERFRFLITRYLQW